jgi:ABC-2 type transport system permease protein
MSAYLRLELLRTLRDRRWLIMTVAMPIALYLLFSAVFGKQPPTNGLSVDVGIMVSMAAFGAMGAVLSASGPRIAQERGNGWLRQLAIMPIAPRSLLLAKVTAAMTLGLPALVLVGLTGVALHGVRLAGWRWLLMLGLLWVGSAPFAALGVLIGRLTDGEVAYGITSGIWFALAAPSGMWMPATLFPRALRTISGVLPSSRFAELGWRVAAGHLPALGDGLVLLAWTAALAVPAAIGYRRLAA